MIRRFIAALMLMTSFAVNDTKAQGWPSDYDGVMLQGFYWDSYSDTKWTKLEKQADELSKYFDLIWIPNSGYCSGSNNMGYLPLFYFNHLSSFGTEDALRSMISTFKDKGVGTIADVVINHHATLASWVDFPLETYNGKEYQLQSTDICANDDGGSCKTWADKNGYSLSSNNDTGEDWSGARDIDHKSDNVNTIIKAYLDFLLNDLGYSGFRYDMVKGYSASFTADYNTTAKPSFSVGEYWDGSTSIKKWIDGTKVSDEPTSAAFDFQFRYRVRDAINQNNWTKLADNTSDAGGRPLIYDSSYRRYAVTFVENHDTEKRANDSQDPIKGDTLAANAYMLAMPGTPCVFLKHWQNCKGALKRMISARKLVGITNQSTYSQKASSQLYYAVETTGSNGSLICVVGKTPESYSVPTGYTKAVSADDFIYYVSDNLADAWTELEKDITEEEAEQNTDDEFTPYDITVYVRNENTWSKMNFYVWDSSNTQINGNWPGKTMTETVTRNGYTWYTQTFTITDEDYYVNLVFSTGTGTPQTIDVTDVNEDKYYVITTSSLQSKYVVEDVTEAVGVNTPQTQTTDDDVIYDISGRRVVGEPSNGIYIKGGKKIVMP